MICAWIETSSAETGSSPTIRCGCSASARAMPIRCRCPPENSCGIRVHQLGPQPDAFEQRRDPLAPFAALPAPWWISSGSPTMSPTVMRGLSDAIGILEDHLHAPPVRQHLRRFQRRDVGSVQQDLPAGRLQQFQQGPADGRFAAAALAHQPQRLAGRDVEGHAVHRIDVAGRAARTAPWWIGKCFFRSLHLEKGRMRGR